MVIPLTVTHLTLPVSLRRRKPYNVFSRSGSFTMVEYTLTVPRTAVLDEIELVNGTVNVHSL